MTSPSILTTAAQTFERHLRVHERQWFALEQWRERPFQRLCDGYGDETLQFYALNESYAVRDYGDELILKMDMAYFNILSRVTYGCAHMICSWIPTRMATTMALLCMPF